MVCIHSLNLIRTPERCFHPVLFIADEIVVFDLGSADGSINLPD